MFVCAHQSVCVCVFPCEPPFVYVNSGLFFVSDAFIAPQVRKGDVGGL